MDDERELEVIRHDMEQTRTSLADKLDALEHTLEAKVVGAKEAVEHTVEAVEHTVEAVKETVSEVFDLRGHVRRHPWLMLGGAFSLGCLGGYLLGGSREPAADRTSRRESTTGAPAFTPQGAHAGNGHAEAPSKQDEESSPLAEGLKVLKGVAVGTLMGLLRETITRALPPEWVPDVQGVVDDWTTRLGGKPLRSDEFFTAVKESATAGVTRDDERDAGEVGRPMGAARR